MGDLRLKDVEDEFDSAPTAHLVRHVSHSQFDAELQIQAVGAMAKLLDGEPSLRVDFSWVLEDGAFASGVEAWLQHEVMMGTVAMPPEDDAKVVVVRMAAGEEVDVKPYDSARLWLVILHPKVLFAHAELLATMRVVELQCNESYEGEDRWHRYDLFGGGKLETLARSEGLGLAFAYARVIDWGTHALDVVERDLGAVFDWLPERAGREFHQRRVEKREIPETLAERLVRAPLRYAVFHGWGTFLTHVFDDRVSESFWPQSAADAYAQRRLLALDEKISIFGLERRYFFGRGGPGIGMAVYLQLARARRILASHREAVRLLCLRSARDEQPSLLRQGGAEIQLRLLNATSYVFVGAKDEDLGRLCVGSFDEMEVFVGLVAARTLTLLGAQVNLSQLCDNDWSRIQAFVEGG